MGSSHFEEKFDAFLENQKYDMAQEALFQVVRAAFIAGWEAAGGPSTGVYQHEKSSARIIRLREP